MKYYFFVLYYVMPVLCIAQPSDTDKLQINGEIKEVFVDDVSFHNVTFRYPDEHTSQTVSKVLVEKIQFSSGREIIFDKKVWPVNSYEDYEKVFVTYDVNDIAGLKTVDNVHAKARGFTGISGINSVTRRAMRKLKTEAAFKGANVVYIADTYQRGLGMVSNAMATFTGTAYNTSPISYEVDEIRPFLEGYSYFLLQINKFDKNWFKVMTDKFTAVYDKKGEIRIFKFDDVFEENGYLYVESAVLRSDQPLKVLFASEERITLLGKRRNTIIQYVLISEKEQRIQKALEAKQAAQ
ncbi:MAG: hypothetical protein JJU28_12640 [Cyclobacteriaceae bacterium]|nr:hypothetical protein [Cyclobacteriaceae bacterium]